MLMPVENVQQPMRLINSFRHGDNTRYTVHVHVSRLLQMTAIGLSDVL